MVMLSQYPFKQWYKRLLVALFDALGGFFFLPLRFAKPSLEEAPIKKILAVRLDHLGDVLMTRPALAALRDRFPSTQIDLLISSDLAQLFEDSREIRRLIPFQFHWFRRTKKAGFRKRWLERMSLIKQIATEHYDLAIDFRGDLRNILFIFLAAIPLRLGYGLTGGGFLLTHTRLFQSEHHRVETNMELLECLNIHEKPPLQSFAYSSQRKNDFWNRFGDRLKPRSQPRLVVHAGAGYPSKRWPFFPELLEKMARAELGEIILIGTKEERLDSPQEGDRDGKMIDLRGETNLGDLPILFDQCDLYIGNDSGPAHLAAAQGLELIILFSGTNDSRQWRPWSDKLHLINHPVPCSPCEAEECPLEHHDCMKKITVDQVFNEIESTLQKVSAR